MMNLHDWSKSQIPLNIIVTHHLWGLFAKPHGGASGKNPCNTFSDPVDLAPANHSKVARQIIRASSIQNLIIFG